ncbi:MAG: glycosyltransferase family 39 protein [Flavobacteriia bacterium]
MLALQPEWFFTKKQDKNCTDRHMTLFRKHALFLSLIIAGLIVRVIFMLEQGFSNDELSALCRTRYNELNDLLTFGVRNDDMHPAFYQVFLWIWVRIFGENEFLFRLPSLLFYVINSALIYRIASKYFSRSSGIVVVALYAGLTFTIINTVFARPYNSGTFFLLLSFLSILEIRNDTEQKWKYMFILIIGLVGAMLSHYFAFWVALVLGISSLFYSGRTNLKYILIAGISAALLFLPHLGITLHQLGKGGLQWLAPPGKDWIPDFIRLFMNNSWWSAAIFVGFLLVLLVTNGLKRTTREMKFGFTVFLFAFSGAFVISYAYTPILRELVMLFLLPFLLIPLIEFIDFKNGKQVVFTSLILTCGLITDSIIRNNLFEPVHFGVFKEIAAEINDADKDFSRNNITYATNSNSIDYINYYIDSDLEESIVDWMNPESVYMMSDRARNATTPFFCYTFNNAYQIPMFNEVIRRHYPGIERRFLTKYSTYNLYTKRKRRVLEKPFARAKTIDSVTSNQEFFGNIRLRVGALPKGKFKGYYLLKCKGKLHDQKPLLIVVNLNRNGEMAVNASNQPLFYTAFDQSRIVDTGIQQEFFMAFELPDWAKDNDEIVAYFWNPEKANVSVGEWRVYYTD